MRYEYGVKQYDESSPEIWQMIGIWSTYQDAIKDAEALQRRSIKKDLKLVYKVCVRLRVVWEEV